MSKSTRLLVIELMRNTSWSQADIAEKFAVRPSTVSKWVNGTTPNESHHLFLKELVKLTNEKALYTGAGMMAAVSKWHYLCARSNRNDDIVKRNAIDKLNILIDAVRCVSSRNGHCFNIDDYHFLYSIFTITAPLIPAVRSHTFADNVNHPQRFIVMVNSLLNESEQREEAFREIVAHVKTYMMPTDNNFLTDKSYLEA